MQFKPCLTKLLKAKKTHPVLINSGRKWLQNNLQICSFLCKTDAAEQTLDLFHMNLVDFWL